VVVAFYLIAQMVLRRLLLFGLDHWLAVVIVGALMMISFGGNDSHHLGANHQGLACCWRPSWPSW
jgi:hypothetical protein